MSLRAALLAMAAAGAFLLLPGCGGGGGGDSGNAGSGPSSNSGGSGSGGAGSSGNGSSAPSANCPAPTPTTIVGGDLFVAEQGPVGMTLLSTGGFTQYTFTFLYDNVFGIATNNPQDKWGQATAFPPGTPVGATAQVQLQPPTPDLIHDQPVPSTFPKGIPIELWLTIADPTGGPPGPTNSSSTASIGKDILGHDAWHTAAVTYGANNTATVSFFASGANPGFSVSLTNVFGSGSPPASSGTCM